MKSGHGNIAKMTINLNTLDVELEQSQYVINRTRVHLLDKHL